jgi:predicted nucleic acid-binding protein
LRFLLDTNIVSEARRRKQNPGFAAWWKEVPATRLYVSALTIGEIERGIEKLRSRGEGARVATLSEWVAGFSKQFSDRILDVDVQVAAEWGRQITRNLLDMEGTGARLHNPFT